jgi:hypothetical protein
MFGVGTLDAPATACSLPLLPSLPWRQLVASGSCSPLQSNPALVVGDSGLAYVMDAEERGLRAPEFGDI